LSELQLLQALVQYVRRPPTLQSLTLTLSLPVKEPSKKERKGGNVAKSKPVPLLGLHLGRPASSSTLNGENRGLRLFLTKIKGLDGMDPLKARYYLWHLEATPNDAQATSNYYSFKAASLLLQPQPASGSRPSQTPRPPVRVDVGGDGASLFQPIPDLSLGSFGG